MHIGIVRRVLVQVVETERAMVAAPLFECVNHGRIALQWHTSFKAVLKHACNKWPFVGLRRFAFDERG